MTPSARPDIAEIMTTALNGTVDNIFSVIGVVLPIGLLVFGMTIAIGYSMKLFKKITK
jgi:hypothetical protein